MRRAFLDAIAIFKFWIIFASYYFISKSDFSDTFEHIVELMDDMAKQVVDAALNETYLI